MFADCGADTCGRGSTVVEGTQVKLYRAPLVSVLSVSMSDTLIASDYISVGGSIW